MKEPSNSEVKAQKKASLSLGRNTRLERLCERQFAASLKGEIYNYNNEVKDKEAFVPSLGGGNRSQNAR